MDINYPRNDRYARWELYIVSSGQMYRSSSNLYIPAYSNMGAYITFTGLQANTEYRLVVWVYSTYYEGGSYWADGIEVNFWTQGTPRPPNFYWSSYGRSPSGLSSTSIFLPRATALNGLSSNIRQLQQYLGRSQTSFSTIYSGQGFVNLVNSQVSAINNMLGYTAINTIPANAAPTGNYFVRIETMINNIG